MSRIHASSSGAVALSPIGSFVSSRVAAPNGSVGNIPTFQSTFAFLRTANKMMKDQDFSWSFSLTFFSER